MSPTRSLFAFQPNEKVNEGFVRVLEELGIRARLLTQNARGPSSESVHDARLLIKHLRALFWFARPAFSALELNPLKSHLRKASHLLAAQRDFVVMRSVVEKLSQKISKFSDRTMLVRIAHAQDGKQAITEKPDQSLRRAVAILVTTIKQLIRKAKSTVRWPSASDRLAQAFLGTKKSEKRALRSEDPAQFHDWRKKAKRLLFQLQLTHAVPGKRMTLTIKRVDRLQEKLGDYHDSFIVKGRLQKSLSGRKSQRLGRHGVKLLERRMHRLRKKVREIAGSIKFK
jgi:CHAD domain-containing protein